MQKPYAKEPPTAFSKRGTEVLTKAEIAISDPIEIQLALIGYLMLEDMRRIVQLVSYLILELTEKTVTLIHVDKCSSNAVVKIPRIT